MAVESPCVKNCYLDKASICIGCGRAMNEISQWPISSDDAKQQILINAKQRRNKRQQHYVAKEDS